MVAFLGIDYGTSSVKTAIIDADTLTVLASASEEYRIFHPHAGYAEQNPEDWWQATIITVQKVIHTVPDANIQGIGLSGQMHGTVCLGKDGNWARPAIIWADTRAVNHVQELTERIHSQPDKFMNIAGMPAAGFMAVSLMWLAQNEPQTLEQTHKVLLPKDAMRYKMTGTIGTDFSDASATWLLDVQSNEWSEQLTDICNINRDLLPDLSQSMDVIGKLTKTAAEELGLPNGIPIVAGGSDLPVLGLGHGLVNTDTGMVTVGTGGQVFLPIKQPIFDAKHRYYTFTHSVPDSWYVQASILSAGSSLRWLRDLFGLRDVENAYEILSSKAEDAPIGADGLLFLPYLAGERTPHMDPSASGMFFGLQLHHGQDHFARAVMEGVAFALKSCLTLIGTDATQMLLSGGAGESIIWSQILSDVFNIPLKTTQPAPYGSIGCAIMAGVGIQAYHSIDDAISRLAQADDRIEPIPSNVSRYEQFYEQYLQLYPLLKDQMHQLQRL